MQRRIPLQLPPISLSWGESQSEQSLDQEGLRASCELWGTFLAQISELSVAHCKTARLTEQGFQS
eukprot:2955814-Amphidinium_carterae.2